MGMNCAFPFGLRGIDMHNTPHNGDLKPGYGDIFCKAILSARNELAQHAPIAKYFLAMGVGCAYAFCLRKWTCTTRPHSGDSDTFQAPKSSEIQVLFVTPGCLAVCCRVLLNKLAGWLCLAGPVALILCSGEG